MPRRKPAGWPKLMSSKRLASGTTGYYWAPPTWAKKAGCPVRSEALGVDYGAAKQRCDDVLNQQYDAWRTGCDALEPAASPGTFDWMVAIYKSNPKYKDRPAKTCKSIDATLSLASKQKLKDGRLFGSLALASITPGVADRLHAKLKEKPGGGTRARTALMAIQYCRRAWNVAWRDKPDLVPLANPFMRMDVCYKAERTRPVSYDELMRFVAAADEAGSLRSVPRR